MTAARPTPPVAASFPRTRATGWAVALIFVAALAAYHNSFRVPLLLDDERAIVHNDTLRRLWPLSGVLAPPKDSGVSGRPLLNLTYAVNYAAGGFEVGGYHAVNLAIHVVAAWTLFGIVRRTLARRPGPAAGARRIDPTLFALAVALLWTVHPLQTESVTYVSERAETLMGLCYLLTLYGFIRYADGRSPFWLVAAWLACLAGVATKESMVTAPAVVLAYDAIFVAGSLRQAWRAHRAFHLGLLASWLFLAWLMLALSRRSVGFHQGISPWEYALTESRAIVHYLRLAFWPSPLVFDYGPGTARGLGEVLPSAAVLLALLAGTAALLRRTPALGFLGLWFFALLAPSSSFVPVALQPIAENRMYLPLAAVLAAGALAAHRLLGARAGWLLGGLALAALAATLHRNEDYRDAVTIWGDTVRQRPLNSRAQNDYGEALARAGRLPEAIAHYRLALQLAPGSAEIRFNLGKALHDSGRAGDALREYTGALRAQPDDPAAHDHLGLALSALGRLPEAQAQFAAALRLDPADGQAHTHLGIVDLQLAEVAAAQGQFAEALRLDPGDAEAHFRLGNILASEGRLAEAMPHWEETLRLRPGNPEAHNNLAMALAQMGRIPEAIAHYQAALQLKPDYALARNNLSDLLAQPGSAPAGK